MAKVIPAEMPLVEVVLQLELGLVDYLKQVTQPYPLIRESYLTPLQINPVEEEVEVERDVASAN